MNFILCEMTYLRYYIPLIIEGNRRGVSSKVYVTWNWSNKYNSPDKNKKSLLELQRLHKFEIIDISEWNKNTNRLTFFVEGVGLYSGPKITKNSKNDKFVCIAVMADYQKLYSSYVDLCDYVIFPNKIFAEEFNTLSEKNLYLGSPKYDVELPEVQDRKRLRAVVVHPADSVFSGNISTVHKVLRDAGFEIFVKTRGKDKTPENSLKGDQYFGDESWFPHTTMELISNSDLVVCWDSGVRKEAVMLEKPILNFNSLGSSRVFKFLHGYDYCVDFDKNENNQQKILEGVLNLIENNFSETYSLVKNKYLWKHNASKKILDYFLEI